MTQITTRMMEAIMFMLDNNRFLHSKLDGRWGRRKVAAAIERLYTPVEKRRIPSPLNAVEKDLLREVIESNLWVKAYDQLRPEQLEMARSTLRDLARLVEHLGVEVNHLPAD